VNQRPQAASETWESDAGMATLAQEWRALSGRDLVVGCRAVRSQPYLEQPGQVADLVLGALGGG
jgi:hypothetical protein